MAHGTSPEEISPEEELKRERQRRHAELVWDLTGNRHQMKQRQIKVFFGKAIEILCREREWSPEDAADALKIEKRSLLLFMTGLMTDAELVRFTESVLRTFSLEEISRALESEEIGDNSWESLFRSQESRDTQGSRLKKMRALVKQYLQDYSVR